MNKNKARFKLKQDVEFVHFGSPIIIALLYIQK